MEITEIRVRLVRNRDDRLKAFCSMTLDNEFVIRDIKIIEGAGGYFVAMPSRKMTDHCDRCGEKNHLRAQFCNGCGKHLSANRVRKDVKGRVKYHADIAHPINGRCRQIIQTTIVEAFHEELARSKHPGYQPVDLEDSENDLLDAMD